MLVKGQPTAFKITERKERDLGFTASFPDALHFQSLLDVDYESLGNHKLDAHFGEQENISAHFFEKSFAICSAGEPRSCDWLCPQQKALHRCMVKKQKLLVFPPENCFSGSMAPVEQNKQSRR